MLYGRNGAGKTRILRGVRDAVLGGATNGSQTLVYHWPVPNVGDDQWFRSDERHSVERAHWENLPGNPWPSVGRQQEVHGWFDEDFRELAEGVSIDDALRRLEDSIPKDRNHFIQKAIKNLIVANEPWFLSALGSDNPTEQASEELRAAVAAACEIAESARCGVWRPGDGNRDALLTMGYPDESSPNLRSLVSSVLRQAETYLDGIGARTLDEAEEVWLEAVWDLETSRLPLRTDSSILSLAGLPTGPHWFGDSYRQEAFTGLGPANLLYEGEEFDIHNATLDFVEFRLAAPERGFDETAFDPGRPTPSTGLLVESGAGVMINPAAEELALRVSTHASQLADLLLEDAPLLALSIHPVGQWPTKGAMSWTAIDPTGAHIPIEQLSAAQERWARFAIQVSTFGYTEGLPLIIIIDEPEAALHRRAERHLANGLSTISEQRLIGSQSATHLMVATHSPAFLRGDSGRLVHVRRGGDGFTEVETWRSDYTDRLRDLGLDKADLLQLCRVAVLVEGEHERWVFDELFGELLASIGAELFAMRGASNLQNASDAQLLFRFTDVPLLVVLDNEDSDRVQDIWRRACGAADSGGDPLPVLAEFTTGEWRSEAQFLREFCSLAITLSARDRVRFYMLSEPDIPEYLPVQAFVPEARKVRTWSQYRVSYEKGTSSSKGKKPNFKQWMAQQHGAEYDESAFRSAIRQLDHIPDEFSGLLNVVQSTAAGVVP